MAGPKYPPRPPPRKPPMSNPYPLSTTPAPATGQPSVHAPAPVGRPGSATPRQRKLATAAERGSRGAQPTPRVQRVPRNAERRPHLSPKRRVQGTLGSRRGYRGCPPVLENVRGRCGRDSGARQARPSGEGRRRPQQAHPSQIPAPRRGGSLCPTPIALCEPLCYSLPMKWAPGPLLFLGACRITYVLGANHRESPCGRGAEGTSLGARPSEEGWDRSECRCKASSLEPSGYATHPRQLRDSSTTAPRRLRDGSTTTGRRGRRKSRNTYNQRKRPKPGEPCPSRRKAGKRPSVPAPVLGGRLGRGFSPVPPTSEGGAGGIAASATANRRQSKSAHQSRNAGWVVD